VEGYRLEARLGRGAVGSVYRTSFTGRAVADWQRRSDLAIKVHDEWLAHHLADPKLPFGARFLNFPTGGRASCEPIKAALVPRILYSEYAFLFQHPGVLMPRVFYFGSPGWCFYVMERIEGSTLRELTGGGRPRGAWLPELRAMVEGLAAHHADDPQFFHGDIKPENVIVEAATGRFRLIDPAARSPGPETTTWAYNPLLILPTFADPCALAILVLELFAGFPPFAGIEQRDPLSPDDVRSWLSSDRFSGVPRNARGLLAEWILDRWRFKEWSYSGMLADGNRLGWGGG
jgi:serine/threonine protein kinase